MNVKWPQTIEDRLLIIFNTQQQTLGDRTMKFYIHWLWVFLECRLRRSLLASLRHVRSILDADVGTF